MNRHVKIFIKVIAAILVFSTIMIVSLFAESNMEISYDRIALSGDDPMRSVTTSCPSCGRMTYNLYCGGVTPYYEIDVRCNISSHQPCWITDRLIALTKGVCSSCYLGIPPSNSNVGTHTESAYHTGTGETYDTCYYS